MGNTKSNNKIPAALCEPTYHIYPDTGAWEVTMLKKFVLEGKLAPFYPPVSEVPITPSHTTNNNTLTAATTNTSTNHHNHSSTNTTTSTCNNSTSNTNHSEPQRGRRRSTNSSNPDRKSSLLSRFQTILHVNNNNTENQTTNHHENSNHTSPTNEPQAPIPLEEYYDECPICMMYYQGGMNVAKCCSQRICSECVIQICKQGPKYAETSSVCPFCKACPFKIDYKGPKPWSQRCKELEEEQAVIQLKIKHQQEEDKQQEEERRKRLESSNSLNNSQHDASVLSTSTRNANTNTSFTSTTTTNTLSNNNSFSSPTISTPSTTQVNPISGISFLESYFANRRMNEQHQQQQTDDGSTTNNSATPTSSTYSTQNQDNDDSYFRYIFGTERAPSSPTRALQNSLISRLQNRFFIEDDENDDDEDEHDYLGYYLAGNRSPIRRPAGPISNNNTRVDTPVRASTVTPSSMIATSGNNNNTLTSTTYGTTNNRNRPESEQIEGLPSFSDFIPTSIDVTNVSEDDEMLNEAIRLSLLEQQQGSTHHDSVILDFGIPIHHTTSNSAGNNATTTTQSISISPINSTPLSNHTSTATSTTIATNTNPAAVLVTNEENDEELQMVLRLSLLDK